MHSVWTKIIADLRAHPARTLLAINSIAIGIFVVGTLLGMMDLELGNMDAAHRQSMPSHISLMLQSDVDLQSIKSIKAVEGVAAVDTLTQFTVRYKTAADAQWQMGTVVFRTDYTQQLYDQWILRSGAWPNGDGLGVERLSAKFAGLNICDALQLETPSGSRAFMLTGVIRHPFVKPPAFGGQVHFFIDPALAPDFGIPAQSFRQMLVQVTPPYSEEKARTVAGAIRNKLAEMRINVNATLLQNPERHWGRSYIAGINLILNVMAWASLALSSVLILNTVAAVITQQTNQIGMLKAVGARRNTIALIYLSEVQLLSVMALFLAIPASFGAAFWSSRWFLDLFNVELPQFAYSSRALLCMLVGGLTVPLLAGLWPIWRGASMSVREALGSYGVSADFARNRFALWLEHKLFRWLSPQYAVALGNLVRRKARLFWTQIVLIIAGVLFMLIMSMIASVNLTLDHELARSLYAVRLGFNTDQASAKIDAIAQSVPQTTAVELWNRIPAELIQAGQAIRQVGGLGMQMLAVPVTGKLYKPLIVAGRWFEPTDSGQSVLVLNAETAALNGIQVGDTVQVNVAQTEQAWRVIGLYRWFAGAGYAVEPVYAPLDTVQGLTHDNINSTLALLAAPVDTLLAEKKYADALKQAFQAQNMALDYYNTSATLEQRQFAQNQFSTVTGMLLGLAGLIATVGGIGLAGTLAMGVLQRTREIGILRAIGADSRRIFSLFMLEGFFHGLLAWMISISLVRVSKVLSLAFKSPKHEIMRLGLRCAKAWCNTV
ncbi:MAG: FtsX-like permease family protein [Methylococcales bacterium]|nr:FtsX-like permease family protein [Methylococcales bacterium]